MYKRKDAFDLLRCCGGIPQLNVTKETDYLVVGYYRKNSPADFKSRKRVMAERYIGLGRHIRIIREVTGEAEYSNYAIATRVPETAED